MSSTYWRFRIAISDHPGGMAEVAAAVGDLGVDVLDVDVHRLDVTSGEVRGELDLVVDDLVVELPFWVEPTMVERALLHAGARSVRGRRVDPHDLVDARARALVLAAGLVRAIDEGDAVRAALRAVVDCDRVWWAPPGDVADPIVVAEARRTGQVATGREWLLRRGPLREPAWVVAVPAGEGVVVAVQTCGPFTATQIARARAVVDLVAAVRDASGAAAG
ncbi:ACT domain-containing protein [Actinomarinicola tropica]|uniref:ACT domain-containing protein n=1 Tax=Actinomarinicola tropica TaxID=2789776 RepID=A0A5Q2RLQ2_9ACTN|nr:hypothetical protein [Actinomarinicola tropica]QGG95007.1 hypothetical protein GH723_07755 [Actinomarinicola tropica]